MAYPGQGYGPGGGRGAPYQQPPPQPYNYGGPPYPGQHAPPQHYPPQQQQLPYPPYPPQPNQQPYPPPFTGSPQPPYGGAPPYAGASPYGGGPSPYGSPPPQGGLPPNGGYMPPPQSPPGQAPNDHATPFAHHAIPAGMQQAPNGQRFQYSNCTGNKKALLIGINYFGQKGELKGCINDVRRVLKFLQAHGYQRNNIVVLTDDARKPSDQPLRENILQAMKWLVANAQPNDSLFFHYSGHGGQTKDLDGDEDDGYDEVIYPVDYARKGHIADDDMHRILVASLQAGVRLTAIFDSCHSGSALDLPYVYSTKGIIKEPNMLKDAGAVALDTVIAYARKDAVGMAKSIFNFGKRVVRGDEAHKKTLATKSSPADVVMWSGSKDEQTSADAHIDAQATGAMSWAFMTATERKPKQSYKELLNNIRDLLDEKRFHQKPQLSSSHPMDVDALFIF